MSHDTLLHRAVRPVVRRIARTRVTPDQVTALRFATALAAGAAFAVGGYRWVAVGAALFALSALLDRADGELARRTRQFSRRGHRYDLVADCAADVMAFIGLGIGAMDGALGRSALTLGVLAGAGITAMFWQMNAKVPATLPRYADDKGRVLADPDDSIFIVPVLLWCFGAELVLCAAGIVAPLAAIWIAVARRRRGASQGRREMAVKPGKAPD